MDIIRKDTPIREAEEILRARGIGTPKFGEIALGMLLSECDYLEVHGFGRNAYFVKVEGE